MSNTFGGASWLSSLSSSFEKKYLRYGIVGCSGSGKTSLAHEFVRYHRKMLWRGMGLRLIVFDPFDEFHIGRSVETSAEFLDSARGCYSSTRFHSVSLWPDVLNLILQGGNCLLVADEAQKLFPLNKTTEAAFQLMTEGRHYKVGILWLTQRPTTCNTNLLGNTAGVIVGRLLTPADMPWSRSWGITTMLPFHEFTAVLPGQIPFQIHSKKM